MAVPAASQCTLCADGQNPVLPSDPTQASMCEQVIALLPDLNPGACTEFQEGNYPLLCGCDASFSYSCDVCPNGGTPNPFGDTNVELCNRIKFSASAATNANQCVANLQTYRDNVNITEVCGCPGVPTPCSICGDGSAVGNPDTTIGQSNTCQQYDTFLSTFPVDSAECAGKTESGLPFVCGCPNAGTGSACSICDGGAQRGEPRVSDFDELCANADNKALFVPLDSCQGNTNMYDQWACGCPDAVPPCTLCEDGSSFVSDRPSDFSKQGQTCAYDQFALKYIKDLDCPAAQATVGETCGCTNPKADLTACRICGTGLSLPDPSIFVESFLHTCGFIEYFASAEAAIGAKTCTFTRGEYLNVCCEGGPDPYLGRSETPVTPPPFGSNPFFQPVGAPMFEPIAPTVAPDPVLAPADAPIVPLTAAPVVPITSAPVTTAPVSVVTSAPVASETSSPVLVPPTSTAAPIASGTAAPIASGTTAPIASGTTAPASTSTSAPVASGSSAPANGMVTAAPITSAPAGGNPTTVGGVNRFTSGAMNINIVLSSVAAIGVIALLL